nr:hypothetical protein BdHM001_35990 [Bdellovibrio sp. HM001]
MNEKALRACVDYLLATEASDFEEQGYFDRGNLVENMGLTNEEAVAIVKYRGNEKYNKRALLSGLEKLDHHIYANALLVHISMT